MSGSRPSAFVWAWCRLCLDCHHPKLNPLRRFASIRPVASLARRRDQTWRCPASWPRNPIWASTNARPDGGDEVPPGVPEQNHGDDQTGEGGHHDRDPQRVVGTPSSEEVVVTDPSGEFGEVGTSAGDVAGRRDRADGGRARSGRREGRRGHRIGAAAPMPGEFESPGRHGLFESSDDRLYRSRAALSDRHPGPAAARTAACRPRAPTGDRDGRDGQAGPVPGVPMRSM